MASQRVNRRATLIPPPVGFTRHIPATVVAGDTRMDAERAQVRAAYDLWLRDLEQIRRQTPLLDNMDVTEVTIENVTTTRGTISRNTPVIDLTNLSDDGGGGHVPGPGPPPPASGREVIAFYRGANGDQLDDGPVSFQARRGPHLNQYPSPGMLRFEMNRLRRELPMRTITADQVAAITRTQLWGTATSLPRTFEDSLQRNWLRDLDVGLGTRLIRGLPLVEDVVFLRAGNYIGTNSNCFWKAIAYQIYGDHSFDVRVKAEHLEYFSEVLRWPQHPKRESGSNSSFP